MSAMIQQQTFFLMDVSRLIQFAIGKGFGVTGGELWRPPETQKIYFEQGKTDVLNGYHQRRLAIDLNFFLGGDYIEDSARLAMFGAYWKSLHEFNRWGGDFRDKKGNLKSDGNHFERRLK